MTYSAKKNHYEFYNQEDSPRWGRSEMPSEMGIVKYWLNKTVKNVGNENIVELGCGKGVLQNIHRKYLGIDISFMALKQFFPSKNCIQASIEDLPIKANSVDFLFSFAAIEHVPQPEKTLFEIDRVLAVDGVAVIAPAWFCRPWAAKGLPIKRYSELGLTDKCTKLLIPLRNNLIWRTAWVLPQRLIREIVYRLTARKVEFDYKRLNPNLNKYIYTDCDAFVSMDPHAAIMFFKSRNYHILTAPTFFKRLFVRNEPVIVKKGA